MATPDVLAPASRLVNRRALLQALGALSLPGLARAESPVPPLADGALLGGRRRASPNFDALHPERPYAIGVRPHRVGGVRLELAEPLPAPDGGVAKQVVHNYGHGACGITLALGCAEQAAGHVGEAVARVQAAGATPSVAVIGIGAVGLTTALAVRRRWPTLPLTLYAASLDVRTTTSWLAGGQFEPSGMWREYREGDGPERFATLLRQAKAQLMAQRDDWGRLGVLERDNFTLDKDHTALDLFTPRDVIAAPDKGLLPFENLAVPGRRYRTWLINPMRWLPAMKADLQAAGASFVERRFAALSDVASLTETVVVNCTGYGAKALWGDRMVIAQRGHLVALQRTDEGQDWLFGGGCANGVISYAFCRHDDVMIGGTWGLEDDHPTIRDDDPPAFARVRSNGRTLFAGAPEACVR